jgi:predicted enzyme related to lactoylglutathione lyase
MSDIRRIHLVYYRVPDLEEGVRFYRDVIGLPLTYYDSKHRDWADFGMAGAKFSLAVETSGEHRCPTAVFGVQGIERIVEGLGAKGVRFTGPIVNLSFGKLARFQDNFGNHLELVESKSAKHE